MFWISMMPYYFWKRGEFPKKNRSFIGLLLLLTIKCGENWTESSPTIIRHRANKHLPRRGGGFSFVSLGYTALIWLGFKMRGGFKKVRGVKKTELGIRGERRYIFF